MKLPTHKPTFALFAAVFVSLSLSSCQFFDDLVAELMDSGGLNSRNVHTVSCIDLKVSRNGPLTLESDLAPKLRQAVSDGFLAAQQSPKGKNLKLAGSLDKEQCAAFYEQVLTKDGVSSEARRTYLNEMCDKMGATMMLWGVYSGDDTEIKVICFLYRSDLNDFTVSEALTFKHKMPERQQQEEVSRVVADLFDKSMPKLGEPDTRKIPVALKKAGAEGKALMPALTPFLLGY